MKLLVAAMSLWLAQAASACQVGNFSQDRHDNIAVLGWQNGDTCRISDFPPPWNSLLGYNQRPGGGSFFIRYEDKQYAYIMFQVAEDGNARVIFHYSNHKFLDGDHFTAAVSLRDENGEQVALISSARGLDPGSVGDDIKQVYLRPEQWQSVVTMTFFNGFTDEQPDQDIWEGVLSMLQELNEGEGGD
jgi:hypothetical protein